MTEEITNELVLVGSEEMTVGDLIERYEHVLAERDAMADAIETFGLQRPPAAPPVVKRPTPTPHGTLNPTDGRSGRTTKVAE